jgi:hypothetical protein
MDSSTDHKLAEPKVGHWAHWSEHPMAYNWAGW